MVDHDKYCGRSLTCQQYLYCADYVDQCFQKKKELKGDESKREYVLAAEKKTGTKVDFNTCLKLARLFAIGQGRPANFTKAAEEQKCEAATPWKPHAGDLQWQAENGGYELDCDAGAQKDFGCKVDGSECSANERKFQMDKLAAMASHFLVSRFGMEWLAENGDHAHVTWPAPGSELYNLTANTIQLPDDVGRDTQMDAKGATRVFELSGYLLCKIVKK